jgi:2-desacetyl-2-hydroxyethyl bacteriochlorophyllide A dehydrogenase
MKALVYRGREGMVVEDVDDPRPSPNEALLKVHYCGICGSDVHLFAIGVMFPGTTPGHEASAEVVSAGSEVKGWKAGDTVAVASKKCSQCEYCLSDRPELCLQPEGLGHGTQRGAFAQYLTFDQGGLLPIPAGLDLAHAALAEPLAVALHAVELSGVEAGQAAVVTGAGPIGLLVIEVLKDRSVHPIIVSEPAEPRRALAAKLGVAHIVDPTATSLADVVRSVASRGAHVVFECTGVPAAAELGLTLLRPAGTLMVVGHSERSYTMSSLMIMARELRIQGCYGAGTSFPRAIEMLAAGKVQAQDIITQIIPLQETDACLRELASNPGQGKVLVDPWK